VAHDHTLMIAVVGAESTGKTTLCEQLGRKLQGLWVPEYLRSFCVSEGRVPRAEEQRAVMQRQADCEFAALTAAQAAQVRFVFCDATPLMTAIYSELLFSDASLFDFALKHHHRYALTLFTQPDMGWQSDGIMRDGAHVQAPVTARVREFLQSNALRFKEIKGSYEQRLQTALEAIGAMPPI
jgi:nicotinamide riboside kinase